MTDILNSIAKWFEERTNSPLYGTFIFSLIIWNWKFFYILFWQSEDNLFLPRIEYVERNILYPETYVHHVLFFLILPILSTYLIIWWFPILNNFAHKIYISFYYKRRLIFDEARLDYEKKERENLQVISVVKKEQAIAKKLIEESTSEDEMWLEEIELFKNDFQNIQAIKNAQDVIYATRGNYTTNRLNIPNAYSYIPPKSLSILDVNGLIQILTQNQMNFTNKGKFFIRALNKLNLL